MSLEERRKLIVERVKLRHTLCKCGHPRQAHHCLGRCLEFVRCHCNRFEAAPEPKLTQKLVRAVRQIVGAR